MGIIKRQSAKSLIVNYLGAAIGALAVLFVYSSNDEIYGFAHWIVSTATLLIPFASFGVLSLVLKYYPAFSKTDQKNYNGFLSLVSILLMAAFFLFLILWKILTPRFYSFLKMGEMNYELFQEFEFFILVLVFLLVLVKFLTHQAANKLRIVVPNIVTQFGFKLFLPVVILFYAWYDWSMHRFAWSVLIFYALAALLLIIYLRYLKGFQFGPIHRPNPEFKYKEMGHFAIFGILNQIGNTLSMRIDSVMIPIILGSTSFNSYYVKAFFMANLIEMPSRSLNQIASPIISKAWETGNLKEISTIYKKASNNLFLVGAFIFLGIWFCLDDLVAISSDPDSFPHVRMIFLLLGLAKVIDMVTSVNSHIIGFSKLFRYNLLFLMVLAVTNLILNISFIRAYGIVGAAMATSLSILLYNLIKLVFIWRRFGLQPFSFSNLKTLILAGSIFIIYFILSPDFHPLVNILIKAAFVSLIYLPIAYFWKISEDINSTIDDFISKYKL